jgi:hypothetical protein
LSVCCRATTMIFFCNLSKVFSISRYTLLIIDQ